MRGTLEEIRDWIDAHPQARLVVIDVLARIRAPRKHGQPLYESDYEAIAALQTIASEKEVAIVIVHHTRKSASEECDPFNEISGTLGLTGAADAALVIRRGGTEVVLYGRGRDITEIDTAVEFDRLSCRWKALGRPSDPDKRRAQGNP